MINDFLYIKHIIVKGFLHSDYLKNLSECFLERYCNKEGMLLYCELINLIAKKEGILIEG